MKVCELLLVINRQRHTIKCQLIVFLEEYIFLSDIPYIGTPHSAHNKLGKVHGEFRFYTLMQKKKKKDECTAFNLALNKTHICVTVLHDSFFI